MPMPSSDINIPAPEQYVQALRNIIGRLSEPQLTMLRAHFQALDRTITADELAAAAGFKSWQPANMHYGRVGTMLRQELGAAGNVGGQKSYVFAYFLSPTENEQRWRWVLHDSFYEALRELGWFEEEFLGDNASDTQEVASIEGFVIQRLIAHRHRERSLRLAKLADARKKHPKGRLVCEVSGCGFDFEFAYGNIGVGYAEVHHRTPLASFDETVVTKLGDLAVVCANCHRMIHRGGQCRDMHNLLRVPRSDA